MLAYILGLASEINEDYIQSFVSLELFFYTNRGNFFEKYIFIAFIKYSSSSSLVDSESTQNTVTFFF